jgi:hypothetical protein
VLTRRLEYRHGTCQYRRFYGSTIFRGHRRAYVHGLCGAQRGVTWLGAAVRIRVAAAPVGRSRSALPRGAPTDVSLAGMQSRACVCAVPPIVVLDRRRLARPGRRNYRRCVRCEGAYSYRHVCCLLARTRSLCPLGNLRVKFDANATEPCSMNSAHVFRHSSSDLASKLSTLKSAQRGYWVFPDAGAWSGSRTGRCKLLVQLRSVSLSLQKSISRWPRSRT